MTATIDYLLETCDELELLVRPLAARQQERILDICGPSGEIISIDPYAPCSSMIEQILHSVRFDFPSLPLLVRGESKEIRLLTPRIALSRLIPSVYSFTYNRYGEAPGTEAVRARFSAALFREMAARPGPSHLSSAYLGLIESPQGPLLAEEVVETCNLEVRVKRFHIGSPVHRYRYTDRHVTATSGEPIRTWSRFEKPVVCFDWRHPLVDDSGTRLADEPLSDDYAAIWIDDVEAAKRLALTAFGWIEKRFSQAHLQLVDICFFIDRTGKVLFGEISPDCMRVRSIESFESDSLDKDCWRSGGAPSEVLNRYQRLYEVVFGSDRNSGIGLANNYQKGNSGMPDYKRAGVRPTAVKNRRLKMSPEGMISLPVAARKALGLIQGRGARVTVAVDNGSVILALGGDAGGFRVSKAGQIQLQQEARGALECGEDRHYWIELYDDRRQVRLVPSK